MAHHVVADAQSSRIEPMSGPGSISSLATWFEKGWRVLAGGGLTQRRSRPGPETDPVERLVVTLEHD